jgi:hypothetical protein
VVLAEVVDVVVPEVVLEEVVAVELVVVPLPPEPESSEQATKEQRTIMAEAQEAAKRTVMLSLRCNHETYVEAATAVNHHLRRRACDTVLGSVTRSERRTRLPRLSDRLPLGDSGLQVSPICLGMIPLGSPDTVLAAFDAGVNFFFVTTDMHWPYYATLRTGLARLLERGGDIRSRIVIAAASYVGRPNLLVAPFLELIEAVPGLGHVDVCVAGSVYADDLPARAKTIDDHRRTGFAGCRATGASFHDRKLVARACNERSVDISFFRYNPAHPGAQEDIFPVKEATSTLLYAFKAASVRPSEAALARIASLPDGVWLPDPTDYYRFALSRAAVDGLLCSPQTPSEIEALARAMEQPPLDVEEEEHMIDLALLARGDAEIVA